MDNSNHNLETAKSCKKLFDNTGKMSFETTEVSPNNNNNKENSEIFDEFMVCDDNCIDNDVDVRRDDNNQSITVQLPPVAVTEKIPPKYDTPCSEVLSTFASPKSKKRKLPSFDELLENLHFNILIMNFNKLLIFLESNSKELTLSFTVNDYEEFFAMIVQDINILKSKSLDANYRDICDKIIEAATSYYLTCAYEYRQSFQRIVMVIKKEPKDMMDPSDKDNGTSSFSCSTDSIMPSSQTSSEVDINEVLNRSPSPGHISSGFKKHCLQTTLDFVKNDITKTKEFTELSLKQAQFMHLLLESVIAFTEFDSNLEIKELYRALWEAVRIYGLKYEFKIKCVEICGGKKSLVFEKVPKQKPPVAVNSNQIMNPKIDVLKIEGSTLETPKSDTPTPKDSKTEAPKPDATITEASKTEARIPEASITETAIPEASKPETSNSNPLFPMPEIPKLMPSVNQKPIRVTKHNVKLFIERLPPKFISDTLNTIHEFLLDEDRFKLVFVPNTHSELDFYRKCLNWCLTTFAVFGDEFQAMHYQISCLLSRVNCTVDKGSTSKFNETTGIKEVTYTKARKNVPLVSSTDSAQSLRNKKKNKKLKKAKLKAKDNAGASKEASVKPTNQAMTWTDCSSSTCSSRGTSRDRSKLAAQARRVAKRALNDINQSPRNTFQDQSRSRRGEETTRKEQLIEALSVPVQSDKAMRMMRGMGWSGGALGARGNGITEPLMPTLDRARGFGFGHNKNGQFDTIGKKPRESKTGPCFVSENSNPTTETDKTENDVIVQKTKQLLLENPTLDSIMKAMEPQKPTTCTAKQQLKALPMQNKFSIELQKPENSALEFPLPFRQEILHSILELLHSEATCKTLKYENKICKKARKFVKSAALVLKSSSNYAIFQKAEHNICRQIQERYKKLPEVVFETLISCDFKTVELKKKVITQSEKPTQQELSNITQLKLKPNSEIISEESLHLYIVSSGTHFEPEKAYEALKFKVLFLLNILSFMKSFNEELEVTFNKVLNVKQKSYIENVVDEVNMRIKFGSSPAETKLCAEIKNHVKDAFLGFMFNHQYTVVSLNKYFRFKRLNRPDKAVKRKCQTAVNLDAFSSETFSEAKLNTNEPTDKENNSKLSENNDKVTENNSNVAKNLYNAISLPEDNKFKPYDNDNSDNRSVEEYNNNNSSVSELLPGEDGVNISNFLPLYDEEKLNTAGIKNNSNINNDSASKYNSNVTENRNKNNIGNWNVVIDNNDNQVIGMERDGSYSKNTEKEKNIVDTDMAEYFVCLDYTEEVVNTGEMTVDINKEKEVNISGNKKDIEVIDQPIRHFDIMVANDAFEIVNHHKDIGINNNDKMIDEVISNTKDTLDQNVIVIGDSDSNDCTENIPKDEIQNSAIPPKNDKDIKEDTDIIMIEIDDEPMEVISITEESIEVFDKKESVELINQEIYSEDLVKVINKVKPSKDVEVTKIEEENSINQIVKGYLDIKSDGDIISKDKLVLSEDICDTHSVRLSRLKTVGTVTDVSNVHIIMDTEIKNVRIVHIQHPSRKLTNEEVTEIQRHISYSIMRTSQLPLLKCHGVQNGALIYSCHNKKTYDWLQNRSSAASYVKVLNIEEVTKMALKYYCYFDFDTKDFFRMIELYNPELSTKDWVVEKTEKDGDYVIFIVRMDKFSVKFIQESNLALFAGIDKVQFSLIWE